MGGKKKTKWRKVPLAEFTKDCSNDEEKAPRDETYQPELLKDVNHAPYGNVLDEPTENYVPNYAEPLDCVDTIWYPTTYIVYNPAEMALYPNYMMPVDNCCYYYTVPEIPQVQEYVPVTYQEYGPNVPKADTVYLVLPSQNLRPPQAAPNISPEWQNRRRRRRYEGYAEYATIPEKANSAKLEEKEKSQKSGIHVNSRKPGYQVSDSSNQSSSTEKNPIERKSPTSHKIQSNTADVKSSSDSERLTNVKSSINKEMEVEENNQKCMKNTDSYDMHTKITTDLTKGEKELVNASQKLNSNLKGSDNEIPPIRLIHNSSKSKSKFQVDRVATIPANAHSIQKTSDDVCTDSSSTKCLISDLQGCEFDTFLNETNDVFMKSNDALVHNSNIKNVTKPNNTEKNSLNSNSPLPDILSTLNKPVNIHDTNDLPKNQLHDSKVKDKNKPFLSKSLSQSNHLSNFVSSDSLHYEMEMELKQLNQLHSLQANQSIYKLAYDANVTDQSEADSRSPSPVDPESQVPTSLTNTEILIHEADSDSDAGSEDVELLPHRYESETFLNENKHVYVNKLSLAVELLRTQETLPYDEEFKRVVYENKLANNIVPVHTSRKVNQGFAEDSGSSSKPSFKSSFEDSISCSYGTVSENQLKCAEVSGSDSAVFSNAGFDSLDNESCEAAKEVTASGNAQDHSEEIRAGYRRFGIQARHYLSPRGAFPLNPCFCCIIM